ncbi:MAG: hypothetical protein ACRYGA_05620 [Janthinobacterium lividum]
MNALPGGAFDGRQAFHERLRAALAAAAREGWRELVFSDSTFADWPLGERACIEALNAWASGGRSLLMLAANFAVFDREHARFVQWRRTWSHVVDCRACSGAGAPRVPSAIWTPAWQMHRVDTERSRGVSGSDPERRRALREQIDECLRHGRPAFPATTLGL